MLLPVFVSRNGELVPAAQACVSVFNPALYGAFGVYESMQIAQGRPFALEAHLDRLSHSAALLGLPLPADLSTLQRWTAEVLQANQAGEGTLRMLVIGPENGSAPTAFIWPQPAPVYPTTFYTEGVPAITFEGQRALPTAKSLNTLVSFMAQQRARAAGVHEALLHHDGYLTEGSNSNLFAVIDGVVWTPAADQVLQGVARDMVVGLAAGHGIALREAPLVLEDIQRWSECFITSTSRHLMPIRTIDGRPVGDGRAGVRTRRLMALFEEEFARVLAAEVHAR